MKKLLLALVMAFASMAGYAQVTFNIRAGGGVAQALDYDYYYGSYYDYEDEYHVMGGAIAFVLESNISPRGKRFTFSPSVLVSYVTYDGYALAEVPLHVGYKVPMGNRSLFIPKIGLMMGYDSWSEAFMCGPSAELAFEIKHFILGINLQEDLIEKKFGVFGTVGVKF